MLIKEMVIPRKTHFAPFSAKMLRSIKPGKAAFVDDDGITWEVRQNHSDDDTVALVVSQPESADLDFVFFDEELGFVNHDYQPLDNLNNPCSQLQIY